MVQQVKEEIIAAFANVPRPITLAVEFGDKHKDSIVPLQNLLGKDWKDLDEQFLNENWSALSVLTAEAYQYYLPALLICSLESSPESSSVFYHTFNRLSPNSWYVLYEGKDEWFDYQTSKLTSEQRHAICSFIGAAFDNYRIGRVEYQIWGENFPNHPASIKIKDYYDRLHKFHYPPAITPKNQELIDLIRSAFDNTPRPISKREGDRKGDPEAPDVTLAFSGLDWRTLHPNFVNQEDTALSFFTDEEFRYFLPAYLIAEIWKTDQFDNDREDIELIGSNCDPVFSLTHWLAESFSQDVVNAFDHFEKTGAWPDNSHLQSELKERGNEIYMHRYKLKEYSGFTSEERKAIIAYLQYRAVDDDYERDQINDAIENYWLKTI